MLKIVALITLAVVVIVTLALWYEDAHPCLEHGPRELRLMQRVGDTMVPIYGRECLRRAE